MLGGRTRFTNSTRTSLPTCPTPPPSTFPTTQPGNPLAAHLLRRGFNAGEARRMSGALEAASIQRAVSSGGTQAGHEGRGAGLVRPRRVGARRRGRRHGQTVARTPKPWVGSAPRGGARDGEPGRLRLPAERGVAHQRFEAVKPPNSTKRIRRAG